MIRSLAFVGMTTSFLVSAMTTPQHADVHAAIATIARDPLFIEKSVGSASDLSAHVSGVLKKSLPVAVSRERVLDAEILRRMPFSSSVRTIAKTFVQQPVSFSETSALWKDVRSDVGSPRLKTVLEKIEWATRKADVRQCNAFETSEFSGDYIALCIARVQRDSSRCEQISPLHSSLKALCLEELSTEMQGSRRKLPL